MEARRRGTGRPYCILSEPSDFLLALVDVWLSRLKRTLPSFPLFPQTRKSDLLCSIRNDLVLPEEQRKASLVPAAAAATNLEEAIKSLSIDRNEASTISRKF